MFWHKKVITRFAPSPTGFLHVGGLRTALYAYLLAKKTGGKFILRIEDTDKERHVEGGIMNILESLYWTGIIPDEGVYLENSEVNQKGKASSYIQSERLDIYKKYAEELIANKHAFYCFCTPERLEQVREERQKNKLAPGYDGHCKNLSQEEIKEKLDNNQNHVIRLDMPEDGVTSWEDEIRGKVEFKNNEVDDQVLLKSDGYPTYHLAVVVDDHDMEITHVIRGEEWISSTPKHLKLYEFFGWKPPRFAHLPLILNSDKSKLSKRQGDVAVLDYKTKGYLPEALINFVAFLGWNPGDDRELFSLEDLINEFTLKKVGKSGAVFNLEKLDWFNREYLKKLSSDELIEYFGKYLPEDKKGRGYMEKLIPILIERISKGSDLKEMSENGELGYFFNQPQYNSESLFWKDNKSVESTKTHLSEIVNILDKTDFSTAETVKASIWPYAEKNGRGEVLWPFRVALSGLPKSPDPFTLASLFDKNETISRLKVAIEKLSS